MEAHDHDELIALRKYAARMNLILEEMEQAAKVGSYILDVETQKRYWSPGMHRIYETDPDSDIPPVHIAAQCYSMENLLLFQQKTDDLKSNGSAFDVEVDMVTARGKKIWVRVVCRAEMIGAKAVRLIGSVQDITERKKATEALRASEQSYHSQFAFNSSIMLLIDPASCAIIDANNAALKFYGYVREQLLSMRITDINTLPVDDVIAAMESVTLEHGKRFVFQHRLADGSLRDVEVSSCRIQIGGRSVHHSIIYDITERLRTERVLQELQERNRLIFENSIEAILFTNPNGKIYSANPEACRILGRSEHEIRKIGRNGVVDPNDPRLAHALEERRRTGTFKGELNFLNADGQPFPVEIFTNIFLDSHGKERTSMFIRDISEKKRAESLLRQSNEDLRLLSDHLNTVRENERTAIAREVHDELGQVFTALKMELMALLRTVSAGTQEISPKAYSIMEMIEYGIRSVQHISSSLRPRLLDDLGLVAAIEWQAEEFQKRTDIPVLLDLPREDIVIGKDIATAVFRIVQESLTNIGRHAGATQASIDLHVEPGRLTFTIRDNGSGITDAALSDTNSFGIIGIRERLRTLGGEVEFVNNGNGGMSVRASIPMN